jgi:hypothetical protein
VMVLLQQIAKHVANSLVRQALPDDHRYPRIGIRKQTRCPQGVGKLPSESSQQSAVYTSLAIPAVYTSLAILFGICPTTPRFFYVGRK